MTIKQFFADKSLIEKHAETQDERNQVLDLIIKMPGVGTILSTIRVGSPDHGWLVEYQDPFTEIVEESALDYPEYTADDEDMGDPGFGRANEERDLEQDNTADDDPGFGDR
jgi:hypothetical protein